MKKQTLKDHLLARGLIKYGQFTLKSGAASDYYFDFRDLVAYPDLLSEVAAALVQLLPPETELIIALPYSALPIGTIVSLDARIPLVYLRKEKKKYGTNKRIEGIFQKGQKAVLIDDVISTGLSKQEAIDLFEGEGLAITDIIVIVDRREDNGKFLEKYNVSSVFKKTDFDIR